MKKKTKCIFAAVGGTCFAIAVLLGAKNLIEEYKVGVETDRLAQQVQSTVPEPTPEPTEVPPPYVLDPGMEMPTFELDGQEYLGWIRIPDLGIDLPVISEWSYPKMDLAPCRYKGSAYQGNLILMAHDYKRHFGPIRNVQEGDEVELTFEDAAGNQFFYKVTGVEVIDAYGVEQMEEGEWDLSLFTCTADGNARYTLRCTKTGEEPAVQQTNVPESASMDVSENSDAV